MAHVVVRLLGHAAAVVDGEEHRVGGPRQASVLALLALVPGRVVPLDALIDGLWGDEPPRSAEKTVRAYLSRLRAVLAGAIEPRGRGYLLHVDPRAVDALALADAVVDGRRLLDAGDLDAARDALEAAVAMAGEVPDPAAFSAPGLRPWLARIEEDRSLAIEGLVEVEIAAGRSRTVIPRLEQLVQQHPYREQLWASLMRALYATGRQADALGAFQRARHVLVGELGVEPGQQLRRLEQAILRQDAAVDTGPRAATLPVYRTSFVGRDDDVSRLRQALETSSVVTVVGPGGSGKTRLVVEALAPERPALGAGAAPRRVLFVDLSRVRHDDRRQVAALVAHELGVDGSLGGAASDAIASFIGGEHARRAVVVLDNCEHVPRAAAALADDVLRAAPGTAVLATSRTPLGVDGEVLLRLDPLAVPTSTMSRDVALAHAGARLFVERARAAMPAIEFTDADIPTIVRIVGRLDGLPLAIEMAAARLRSMSAGELVARIERGLGDLAAPRHAQPERHASLSATIQWSYDLLTDPARRLLRLLAVFDGGWTLAAAETAFGGEPFDIDVVAHIDEIVAASLVELRVQHGSGRYRLLDTVREFAADRLSASGDGAAASAAHARWALALAEANECELFTSDVDVRCRVLDSERENLLAATEWALDHDADVGPRLAAALGWWWLLHADHHTGTRIVRRALAIERGPTLVRARLLRRFGSLLSGTLPDRAWRDEAAAVVDEAIVLAERLGDEVLLANALHNAAYMHRSRCELAAARERGAAAVALRRRLGDPAGLAVTLGLLAEVSMESGELEAAAPAFAECLALMKEVGSRHGILALVHSTAELAALRGDDDEALALVDEASPIADELGDRMHLALLDQVRGHVWLRRGDPASACGALRRSIEALWEQRAGELLLQTLDVLVAALARACAPPPGGSDPARAGGLAAADAWMVAVAVDAARRELRWPRAPAYAPLAADARAMLSTRVGDEARALSARASAWTLATLVERSVAAAARVAHDERDAGLPAGGVDPAG